MDELTQLLHRFSVEVVEASRQVSRDAIAHCMNAVIQPILSSMARADARFKCYVPLPTEQNFEAMKVSASDEFELIVVLDNLVQMKSFRDVSGVSPELSCYGEVTFTNSFANAMWAADMCVAGRHGPQSFLSAAKIRQYFAKLVTVIAADLFNNGTAVQVSFKDPYTQVKICRHGEQFIFQLVPALYFHEAWPHCTADFGPQDNLTSWLSSDDIVCCRQLGFFALPLPCPFSQEESLWRLSFVRAEKFLLCHHGLGTPRGVRKQVERILKMLRTSDTDAFRPLSSYHLRTAVLHFSCQQASDPAGWLPTQLGPRLLEVLRHLIVCLEKGRLPHFFVAGCNLLAQHTQQELLATAQRLRQIHDELCNHPAQSIRLQC